MRKKVTMSQSRILGLQRITLLRIAGVLSALTLSFIWIFHFPADNYRIWWFIGMIAWSTAYIVSRGKPLTGGFKFNLVVWILILVTGLAMEFRMGWHVPRPRVQEYGILALALTTGVLTGYYWRIKDGCTDRDKDE